MNKLKPYDTKSKTCGGLAVVELVDFRLQRDGICCQPCGDARLAELDRILREGEPLK